MDPTDNSPRTEPVELTDEDLQAASGGAGRPAPTEPPDPDKYLEPPDPDLIGLLLDPPDPDGVIVEY
jgi:hypothetical protein